MLTKLNARLTALERATVPTQDRVTIIHLVAAGEPRKPMATIEHRGRVWEILPDETEAAFICRVRSEINDTRLVIFAS